MHPFTKSTISTLEKHVNVIKAKGAKAYMRNQFEYLGLSSSLRRLHFKLLLKKEMPLVKDLAVIVKELWSLPEREYQYCAMELIDAQKKGWDINIIKLLTWCITHKSWWDTVDFLAANCAGTYFKKFPKEKEKITAEWNTSSNLWLQRSSLLFQLKYKNGTDTALMSGYISHLAGEQDFFIRKAIGWVLREYSKTNPKWVSTFISENKLSPLSIKEGLKRITRKEDHSNMV